MFLTRISQRLRHDDRGVALAAVLGFMAVGVILSTMVASSVVISAGYSTNTRAGVQSESAAAAGIAAARAGLIGNTCAARNGTYSSSADPKYVATIWTPSGSSWVRGCPADTSTQVRILSTGYASATATADHTSDATNLEAILSVGVSTTTTTPTTVTTPGSVPLTPSGPAIYAYNSSGFGGSGSLKSSDGSIPNVLVKTGDMDCSGAATGVTNLVVAGGAITIEGSCSVPGNLWSSGRASFVGAGRVGGTVVANGVTLSGSASIGGGVWSSSDLTLSGNGTISGVVKAMSFVAGGGTLSSNGYIYGATNVTNAGATTLQQTVLTQSLTTQPPTWWGSYSKLVVKNPISSPTFSSDRPAAPTVPGWVDFGAKPDDYTSTGWPGFTVRTMTGTCNTAALQSVLNTAGTSATVIDARGCSGGVSIGGADQVSTNADVAIISNAISFNGSSSLKSASGTHRLWLINPDTVADQLPTCAGQSLAINGTASFPNENVFLYSPCTVSLQSSTRLTGQIYGGKVSIAGAAAMTSIPVGLPGWDLDAGSSTTTSATTTTTYTTTTTPGAESTRSLVSQRQVQAGN